tara:strand:- start:56487 stop:58613 length:2127 start_codon:yes stop_codon:yes gene_type:complete
MTFINSLRKHSTDIALLIAIFVFFPFVYSLTFKQTGNIWRYPLGYGEDGALTLAIIKGIIQNGWYLENPYLGAPFNQLNFDFPIPDLLFLFIIKILGLFRADHFQIFNMFFYLSYSMVGCSAFAVLRRLNISPAVSLLGAFVFAFLPYHQLRLNHLFLINYFAVPVFAYYAYKCFLEDKKISGKELLISGALITLASAGGVYYAFFGGFFIGVSATLAWLKNSNILAVKRAISYIGVISVTVLLCISPNIVWQMENGKNPTVGQRIFMESEVFGLKIAQLVLPMQGHRLGAFAKINRSYSSMAPNVNENAGSSLGMFGVIGFLGLLLMILDIRPIDPKTYITSRLNFLGVLFATVGGAGVLFSMFVTPQFRGMNRISTFIAFYSIVYFCVLVDKIINKINLKLFSLISLRYIAVPLLFIFSYWDQVSPQHAPGIVHAYSMFDSNDSFFKNLEKTVPSQAMIYQLPYVRYPESQILFKEGYYALVRPYLHTEKIKWSYGQMGYRDGDAWMSALSAYPIEKQIAVLTDFPFSGVLIDRLGLRDNGADLEGKLNKLIPDAPLISPDKRYSYYSFENYKGLSGTETLLPIFNNNWYPPETDGPAKWMWSRSNDSSFILKPFSNKTTRCIVKFNLQASKPSIVTMTTTDASVATKSYDFNKENNFDVTLDILVKKEGTRLSFKTETEPIQLDASDARYFSFRLRDLTVCGEKF